MSNNDIEEEGERLSRINKLKECGWLGGGRQDLGGLEREKEIEGDEKREQEVWRSD